MKSKFINLNEILCILFTELYNYKLFGVIKILWTIRRLFLVFVLLLLLQSSFIMYSLENPKEPLICKVLKYVETVKHWMMMNVVFVCLKKRSFKFQSHVVTLFVENVYLTFMIILRKSSNVHFVDKRLMQFSKYFMMRNQKSKEERFHRK